MIGSVREIVILFVGSNSPWEWYHIQYYHSMNRLWSILLWTLLVILPLQSKSEGHISLTEENIKTTLLWDPHPFSTTYWDQLQDLLLTCDYESIIRNLQRNNETWAKLEVIDHSWIQRTILINEDWIRCGENHYILKAKKWLWREVSIKNISIRDWKVFIYAEAQLWSDTEEVKIEDMCVLIWRVLRWEKSIQVREWSKTKLVKQ